MVKLVITENEGNQRLDRFLRKYLRRAPLSMIYKLIRKDVKVNGKRGKEDTLLNAGDEVSIYIPGDKLEELTAQEKKHKSRRNFGVVYEDENLLFVNKPSGLLTHGDAREKKNTLINQVYGYLQDRGEYHPAVERVFAPAAANRLDRNTSGLVVIGKNSQALREMTAIISEKSQVKKIYRTFVCGCLQENLTIDYRLVKDEEKNLVKVAGKDEGKASLTRIRPVITGKRLTLAEIELVTGRTHQIRVHLAKAGFPVAGDAKYGNRNMNARLKKEFGISSQVLHAERLEFGSIEGLLSYLGGMTIEAPEPEIFERLTEVID